MRLEDRVLELLARASSTGTFNGRGLMVLHFEDGVRIGPITTSDAGLAQMPYHIDLSRAALEELFTWWKESRA